MKTTRNYRRLLYQQLPNNYSTTTQQLFNNYTYMLWYNELTIGLYIYCKSLTKHNVVNQYPISGIFHLMCDLCSFVNVISYGSVKSDLRLHKSHIR